MKRAPVVDPAHAAGATGALDASDVAPASPEARCPVPHAVATLAPGCPVPHGATQATRPRRSAADERVRRLLRIRERPEGVTAATAQTAFQTSMLISAIRCTLTYVVFPFVLPAIGVVTQGAIGIGVGLVAMVCDVLAIRRFFAAEHRYRWHFSAIVVAIMALLAILLVQDVAHVLG